MIRVLAIWITFKKVSKNDPFCMRETFHSVDSESNGNVVQFFSNSNDYLFKMDQLNEFMVFNVKKGHPKR